MSSFKVISYYSPDYAENTSRLKETLMTHEIEYELTEVKPFKNWLEGVRFKPTFIREQLKKADCPLVWLDADATVEQYPRLFDTLTVDFACHFRNDKRYYNECLSGTLFFAPTDGSFALLDSWLDQQKKEEQLWDQRSLQKAIETTHSFSMFRLPPNYTQIFDTMSYAGEPVILHHQASRTKDKTATAVNMVGNPQ